MDTERTARQKYLHDADLALADIDRALAPPIDIDELVHHPTQWVHDVAKSYWWQRFMDGELTWARATALADHEASALLSGVEYYRRPAEHEDGRYCWRCRYGGRPYAPGDDLCDDCRRVTNELAAWSDAARARTEAEIADPPRGWGATVLDVDGAPDLFGPYRGYFASVK
jgi:hypothetical protein